MLEEIIKIASDLIRFPSVHSRPRDRRACFSYLEKFFADAGIKYEVWEPGDVRNLVVKLGDAPEPVVCLNGHYDVVDSQASGFRPKLEGDKLFGRGSADMKASLASMMILIRELHRLPSPPSVALMAVGDEEVGGERGTAHLLKSGFRCGFAIAGEPTRLSVANQSKGFMSVELLASGVSGHSARPWEGDNAIFNFFRQFPAVWEVFGEPEPFAWQTTMAASTLSAGDSTNRIPDLCACRLDIRYVPLDDPGELVRNIKKAAPDLKVRVVEEGKALYTDPQDPYLLALRKAATEVLRHDPGLIRKHASSDARHFSARGIPAAVFGPGGEKIHGIGEWVDLRQVNAFYRILKKFVHDAQTIPSRDQNQKNAEPRP